MTDKRIQRVVAASAITVSVAAVGILGYMSRPTRDGGVSAAPSTFSEPNWPENVVCMGDTNRDGLVNHGDIDGFVACIGWTWSPDEPIPEPGEYCCICADIDGWLEYLAWMDAGCVGDPRPERWVVNSGDIDAFVAMLGD